MRNHIVIAICLIINFMLSYTATCQQINWQNTYSRNGLAAKGYSIRQTTDGGYVICGSVEMDNNLNDVYVIRLNSVGDTLWTKTIGGAQNDEGYCIRQTGDTGFIVAGYTESFGQGAFDFFLVKLADDGEIQWTRTNGAALDEASYQVIPTMDGGYLAVGYTLSQGAGGSDVKVAKFTASSMLDWEQTYGGDGDEVAYGVCQMHDSSFIICGSTNSIDLDADDMDAYVICTDPRGDTLWTHVYAMENDQYAYAA